MLRFSGIDGTCSRVRPACRDTVMNLPRSGDAPEGIRERLRGIMYGHRVIASHTHRPLTLPTLPLLAATKVPTPL